MCKCEWVLVHAFSFSLYLPYFPESHMIWSVYLSKLLLSFRGRLLHLNNILPPNVHRQRRRKRFAQNLWCKNTVMLRMILLVNVSDLSITKVHKSKGRTLFVVYVNQSKNKLGRFRNKIHLFTFISLFSI